LNRIAFITDSHLGSDQTGFQQQPRRPDLASAIFEGLQRQLQARRIELLIHGGDLVDHGTIEEIQQAHQQLQSLSIATAACLGNHDLATRDSFDFWRAKQRQSVGISWADGVVKLEHADILLLNAAWGQDGASEMFWDPSEPCREAVFKSQLDWLDGELTSCGSPRPAILVIHAPLEPLPPGLTGATEPLHVPVVSYRQSMYRVLDRHPRVKLVLTGHNHATCATIRGGRVHLSLSSIIEPPFEFLVIQVGPRSLAMDTVAAITMPSGTVYKGDMAWVNGRPSDRSIRLDW